MSENEEKEWRREELRGLFTLGLMAILITLRIGQHEIVLPIMGQNYIFTGVVDFTLASWGVYAFLMIVSFSTDFFPERICEVSHEIGLVFLFLTIAMYYVIVMVIAFTMPDYWKLLGYLSFIPILYVAVRIIVGGIRFLIKMTAKGNRPKPEKKDSVRYCVCY
jgi:hypothetical protein